MKKTLLILAGTLLLGYFLQRHMVLEDDLVRSLAESSSEEAGLFERYQAKSPFRGKVFVELGEISGAERDHLEDALREAGYRREPLFQAPAAQELFSLAPLLPAEEVRRLLGEDALRARAEQATALAALPGADAALAALQTDPAGLGPALLARFSGGAGGGPALGSLLVYRSPAPLDYEKVEKAEAALSALSPRVHYIGGDFFALANYQAVRRDVFVCSTLTLALNLVVFLFFASRWSLLALLFLGTAVSYVTGLAAIRVFCTEVFAVVLAYTSTFVGYNNEALVHLSGIEESRRSRSLLAIWSAIGTTVVGFLVLLLGRSVVVRQMALASLGGLFGFLLFLLPYRTTLAKVRFRGFHWPKVTVTWPVVVGVLAASAAGIVLLGIPRVETRIEDFRFQTPALEAQAAHFERRLDALSLENVVAVRSDAAPSAALAPLAARGLVDLSRHPLRLWRPISDQAESLRALAAGYPAAARRVGELFAAAGIRLEPEATFPSVKPLDEWSFLEKLGAVGPVRWVDGSGAHRWVFAGLRPGAAAEPGLLPMNPRHHYDALLTDLSRQLGWLFLAGLVAMAIFLLVIQRSLVRVAYVFTPLALSALAGAAVVRFTGGTLDIVHFMAFSLVIALATDYAAVVVSTEHGPVELTKVLLTGLSTLATFGVLVFARHPVMRDLGTTVAIGCAVSLVFALFVRLPPEEEHIR